MRRSHVILLALATGIVLLTAVASAHPSSTKQRVAITAKGTAHISSTGRFVLEPLGTGALELDSGTESSVIARRRSVTREGQSAEIVTWVTTCEGKRGSFMFRARIEHVDAGNGSQIGTGTWEVVRGTGAYAVITGGGGAWPTRRTGRDPGPNAARAS